MKRLHPLQQRTLEFIREHQLIDADEHVLIAVSGGPDSSALLHVLHSLQGPLRIRQLTVIHFDHQLRGQNSVQDAAFTDSLAHRLGLPFHFGTEDVRKYQEQCRVSLEMAARACRHRFFQGALLECRAQRLALGHNADDQAEEILLRLLRGTGPAGMAGMLPEAAPHIIRPLLHATRKEILLYLRGLPFPFREDPSNASPFCQRNLLRLRVMPVLRTHFHDKLTEILSRHAQLARDEEAYWNDQVQLHWHSLCLRQTTSHIVLKLRQLLGLHPALQRRIVRFALSRLRGNLLGVYRVHLEYLEQWMPRTISGKMLRLSGDLWAARQGETLILAKEPPFAENSFRCNVPRPGRYRVPELPLSFSIREMPFPPRGASVPGRSDMAWLDAELVRWPLQIRSWEPGDRFKPLGLNGTKKLQDFFTDARIPRGQRNRVPVLCDHEKICWVVGYRLDERVKVTHRTKRLLVVEVHTDQDKNSSADGF